MLENYQFYSDKLVQVFLANVAYLYESFQAGQNRQYYKICASRLSISSSFHQNIVFSRFPVY